MRVGTTPSITCSAPGSIAGGVADNLANLERWLAFLRASHYDRVFVAPYHAHLRAGADDADPVQRERGMLEVILGETLEHKRFFEQARAGRTDLLGRRTASVGALVGQVLPTRWLE